MSRKITTRYVLPTLFLLSGLALFLMPGCGGNGGGTTAGTGTLQVGLTDKPSDSFQQVVVSIREVRVVPAGLEDATDDDSRLPVIVTYATPHSVDILTLRFQQELLGNITLPAGTYNQVRLILEPNPTGQGRAPVNYLTLKTDSTVPKVKIPLTTPSAQQSGLKVKGRFTVVEGTATAILLDFDPNTAIVSRGNGEYNLKPTGIRLIQATLPLAGFGSLAGTVAAFSSWSSATVAVVPQGGVAPIAASTIFSNFSSNRWTGPFTAFVPRGDYRVHVQARGFTPYSSPVAAVVTGSETALGEVILLPISP